MGKKLGLYDKERTTRLAAVERAKEAGRERQEDGQRRCPVQGCTKAPKSYSRYCKSHADRLRANGHPTLDLRIQSKDQYEAVLKIGRWVRRHLTENDSDGRAWDQVERELMTLGRDPVLRQYDIATIVRRQKHWRNAFKAGLVLARRLNTADPKAAAEEVIAAFLGMSAVIIKDNDVLVNRRQLHLFVNKGGARAIVRYMRFSGTDEFDQEKRYRWYPSPGTITAVGAIVNAKISRAVGGTWWKRVDEAMATIQVGVDGNDGSDCEDDHWGK